MIVENNRQTNRGNPQNPKQRFFLWLLILSVHHAFRMNNNPIHFNKILTLFFSPSNVFERPFDDDPCMKCDWNFLFQIVSPSSHEWHLMVDKRSLRLYRKVAAIGTCTRNARHTFQPEFARGTECKQSCDIGSQMQLLRLTTRNFNCLANAPQKKWNVAGQNIAVLTTITADPF